MTLIDLFGNSSSEDGSFPVIGMITDKEFEEGKEDPVIKGFLEKEDLIPARCHRCSARGVASSTTTMTFLNRYPEHDCRYSCSRCAASSPSACVVIDKESWSRIRSDYEEADENGREVILGGIVLAAKGGITIEDGIDSSDKLLGVVLSEIIRSLTPSEKDKEDLGDGYPMVLAFIQVLETYHRTSDYRGGMQFFNRFLETARRYGTRK